MNPVKRTLLPALSKSTVVPRLSTKAPAAASVAVGAQSKMLKTVPTFTVDAQLLSKVKLMRFPISSIEDFVAQLATPAARIVAKTNPVPTAANKVVSKAHPTIPAPTKIAAKPVITAVVKPVVKSVAKIPAKPRAGQRLAAPAPKLILTPPTPERAAVNSRVAASLGLKSSYATRGYSKTSVLAPKFAEDDKVFAKAIKVAPKPISKVKVAPAKAVAKIEAARSTKVAVKPAPRVAKVVAKVSAVPALKAVAKVSAIQPVKVAPNVSSTPAMPTAVQSINADSIFASFSADPLINEASLLDNAEPDNVFLMSLYEDPLLQSDFIGKEIAPFYHPGQKGDGYDGATFEEFTGDLRDRAFELGFECRKA